jgi:hypothetical protein
VSARRHAVAAAFVFALAFAVYAPTISFDFVYPDTVHVVGNEYITKFSYLKMYFGAGSLKASQWSRGVPYYRPMYPLSFLLDYKAWGFNPAGFHLTNVLYHAFAGAALYVLLVLMTGRWRLSLLASSLFALHTVHTEAVDWISGRSEAQAGLFVLLSFIFCIMARRRRKGRAALLFSVSVLWFSLALLSKEVAVMFPLVLVLYEALWGRHERGGARYLYLAFFGAATAVYFALRVEAVGAVFGSFESMGFSDVPPDMDWAQRLSAVLAVSVSYLRLLVAPVGLRNYYAVDVPESPFEAASLARVAILVAVFAGIFYSLRKSKTVFFWSSFTILMLLPVTASYAVSSKFAQTLMSERYLYLPSAGFCVLAALALVWLWERGPAAWAKPAAALAALALSVTYGSLTLARHGAWKDQEAHYKSCVEDSPWSSLANFNLGLWYFRRGERALAKKHMTAAIRLNRNSQAISIASWEEFDRVFDPNTSLPEAIAILRRIIVVKPNDGT